MLQRLSGAFLAFWLLAASFLLSGCHQPETESMDDPTVSTAYTEDHSDGGPEGTGGDSTTNPDTLVPPVTEHADSPSGTGTTEPTGSVPDLELPTTTEAPAIIETAPSTTAPTAAPFEEEAPVVKGIEPLSKSDYYGLRYLQTHSGAERLTAAYKRIAAGIESADQEIPLYDGSNSITPEELSLVYACYAADYPQHFWTDGYTYFYDGVHVIRLCPKYTMTGSQLTEARSDLETAASAILADINGSMSEYHRALYIHDALCAHVAYDSTQNSAYIHTAYGALVNGLAVCDGYSKAYQYLLYKAGIQCLLVTGSSVNPSTGSPEGHAWTIVYIDGEPYHFDVTWDDQDYLSYAYFGLTTAQVEEDHIITGNDYDIPVCMATQANYFVRSGGLLAGCDLSAVAELLRQGGGTARIYLAQGDVDAFLDWFIADETGRQLAEELGIYGQFTISYSFIGREALLSLAES